MTTATGGFLPVAVFFTRANVTDDYRCGRNCTQARQHFFLPRRFHDPFGNRRVSYDRLSIHARPAGGQDTQDALQNDGDGGQNDYRVLQPKLITDPNGNRVAKSPSTRSAWSSRTAVMGKTLRPDRRRLAGRLRCRPDLTRCNCDSSRCDGSARSGRLHCSGNATTRIVYDLDRSVARSRPSRRSNADRFAATLARETHVSDPLPRIERQDPDQLQLLRRLRARDSEEDSGRAGTGRPQRPG